MSKGANRIETETVVSVLRDRGPSSIADIRKAAGWPKRSFARAMESLIRRGTIEVAGKIMGRNPTKIYRLRTAKLDERSEQTQR